jgi:hypothetical protein
MISLFKPKTKGTSVTLSCFSPPVILLTFAIEAGLAIYTWWKYRASRFGKLSVIFLALLSLFQISEWFICQGQPDIFWSRVGFVATAFLPILGLDFISILAKKKYPVWLGYIFAAAFSFVFVFLPNAFTAAQCTGKFVVFQGGSGGLDILYGAYYIITLALGVCLIIHALRHKTPHRKALAWLLTGYLVFITPTVVIYFLAVSTQGGVSSILCGFAILIAVIHVAKVFAECGEKSGLTRRHNLASSGVVWFEVLR